MGMLDRLLKRNRPADWRRSYTPVSASGRAQAELQRDLVLAGIEDNNPVWTAVLSLLDEHAQNEAAGAFAAGLSDGDRQFAAGAAATADYLCVMLRDARVAAAQRVRKEKQKEA